MFLARLSGRSPDRISLLLALASAGALILAFPNFEWWWMAWFGLVPLMWAVEREKASAIRSFLVGWLFGTTFFFGTCWWLTYAPIHYASIPWPLAYLLILIATAGAGLFPAMFAGLLSFLLRRFGPRAFLAAPFVWVFTEFLRYWVTGNNWNAVGYSQAFALNSPASIGGVYLVTGQVILLNVLVNGAIRPRLARSGTIVAYYTAIILSVAAVFGFSISINLLSIRKVGKDWKSEVVAIQPNVPMTGLDYYQWGQLRKSQFAAAEAEVKKLREANNELPVTVILPESPMNFMYNDDREFQAFVRDFTTRNNVSLIFNSAEPDATNGKYFNSAMMIGADGRVVAQYDKIYLLPFGEAVPVPFESILPAFVGNFSYGREYDILPVGDAKAGVMICFESHFGQLSRQYVRDGADILIEMTNDGYLGPTPVLRQHLANAVFRAVETNRPVLRVTNVGITAYINERGQVLDPLPSYSEGTRVWSVSKSEGSQTFYVRYGDWFAWLCTIVTVGSLILSFRRKREVAVARA